MRVELYYDEEDGNLYTDETKTNCIYYGFNTFLAQVKEAQRGPQASLIGLIGDRPSSVNIQFK